MTEISPAVLSELQGILQQAGANGALIKALSKNHNDKNQVYSGSDFQPLHPYFDFEFDERVGSVSAKKGGKTAGNPILEAVFRNFRWLSADGTEVPAKNLKMIIYPQYPEARLSGFDPVRGQMPQSLSVSYTKANPDAVRYLVLARRGSGDALGVMVVNPGPQFIQEVKALPSAPRSRVWKEIDIGENAGVELQRLLSPIVRRVHNGARLDKNGTVIPFNGTQVCGFTLEQALGIVPNSGKNGDFKGIELKTHTQKKVTLFTPEPDLGAYQQDFIKFMVNYGYEDANGSYRLTGVHRQGVECSKSQLTLLISNYDPEESLASQSGKEIIVGLFTRDGHLAAGWSLPRILNCWGAKHNEVVYVPASKRKNADPVMQDAGYSFEVSFENQVRWCRQTSADRLLQAIHKGTIFLDPAPKYVPGQPKKTKRRSQWRVNDIGAAVGDLYDHVEEIEL